MLRRLHPLLLTLVILGATAASAALILRYRAEARSRPVGLVLDYNQVRSLAAATGVPVDEALRRLKNVGITGVAITGETLGELGSDGLLEVRAVPSPTGREYRVAVSDPAVGERVAEWLTRMVPGTTGAPPPRTHVSLPGFGGGTLYVPGRFEDIRAVPVGPDPLSVQQVRQAGLSVVGRIQNPIGVTRESLRWMLGRLQAEGMTTVIFAGEEVLGYRKLIPETAQAFRELGMLYGSVEFGKQRGDEALSRLLPDRMVRVHSISPAEMTRLTPPDAVERYVRAASERNIRLNYVRLPEAATGDTFEDAVSYVRRLARETAAAGFGLAEPLPFSPVWPSPLAGRLAQALIALGIGAGAVMLLAGVVPLPDRAQVALGIAAALVCAALAAGPLSVGQQAVALLAAVVFPTLAFVLFPQPLAAFEEHEHAAVRYRSEAVVPAVAEFAVISLVTLIGAVMTAGLLSELPYLVKIRSFLGIKLATALPLLLVGGIYLSGVSGLYPSLADERRSVEGRLRGFSNEPVRIWHTAAFVVAVVALALLLARSGNDPGVGVSELELRFRSLLDRLLGVRPRTKEFLIGHPALLLSLAMAAVPRWRFWAFPLMLVGIIGQVGMLNSFCHLHTPIRLTLLRTFHGLWIGGLLGLLLIGIWNLLEVRLRGRDERLPV